MYPERVIFSHISSFVPILLLVGSSLIFPSGSHDPSRLVRMGFENLNTVDSLFAHGPAGACQGELVRVAFLTDVREYDGLRQHRGTVKNIQENAGTLIVRQMSDLPDATFEPERTTRILKHVHVVIGLDNDNVGIGNVPRGRARGVGDVSRDGDLPCPAPCIREDTVSETSPRRIVGNRERLHMEPCDINLAFAECLQQSEVGGPRKRLVSAPAGEARFREDNGSERVL